MKIGLALSGGGAKGVYHLGFLQYLKEQEIKFDVISGTSAGSLAGTLFVLGYEPEIIKNKLKTIKSKSLKSMFKSLGGTGLVSFDSMVHLIEDHILEVDELTERFCDIEANLNIVSTELLSGNEVVFNKENTPEMKLMTAMLASSSYPMVFAPVEIKEGIYSDGGITNHFPAEITKEQSDYTLGIFVTPETKVKKESLKSSRNIALRAMNLQGYASELKKFELCDDIIFQEELSNYKTFDISEDSIDKLYELGYEDAKNNKVLIKKLKQLIRYKYILGK